MKKTAPVTFPSCITKETLRITGLTLLLAISIAAIVKAVLLYVPAEKLKSIDNITTALFNKTKQLLPPGLAEELIEKMNAQDFDPALIQEEQKSIAEQVALIDKDLLTSPDENLRYSAAQLLSAYPTPQSEALLLRTLSDKSPAVRKAAIDSLSYFETLSNPTIDALITEIGEKQPEIQASAITTLQQQLNNEIAGTERYQTIMRGLELAQLSPNVTAETREVLREFVEEQQSIVGSAPPPPPPEEVDETLSPRPVAE